MYSRAESSASPFPLLKATLVFTHSLSAGGLAAHSHSCGHQTHGGMHTATGNHADVSGDMKRTRRWGGGRPDVPVYALTLVCPPPADASTPEDKVAEQ